MSSFAPRKNAFSRSERRQSECHRADAVPLAGLSGTQSLAGLTFEPYSNEQHPGGWMAIGVLLLLYPAVV